MAYCAGVQDRFCTPAPVLIIATILYKCTELVLPVNLHLYYSPAAILAELGELVLDLRPLRPLPGQPPRLEVALLVLHQPPRSWSAAPRNM